MGLYKETAKWQIRKLQSLTDLSTGIATADLFHVVDDPTGTPINKKVSVENVFNFIPVPLATNTVETKTALTVR